MAEYAFIPGKAAMAEQAVRMTVMLDEIEAVDELLSRNVGAKLAADYWRLVGSVSPIALAAAWRTA